MSNTALALCSAVLLAVTPVLASADEHCAHSAPRQLDLEVTGVKAVVFEVASHDLDVVSQAGATARLQGRACASDAKLLEQLKISQQRQGDKLVVQLRREGNGGGLSFGNRYAYLDLRGTLPDSLPVQLKVGSGDARVSGAPVVSADVNSGDITVRNARGLVAAKIGSGDLDVDGAGSLQIISIGSGDASARNIRGETRVGSIGSGDFELDDAQGPVEIASIGSGDADLSRIGGNLRVGSIGSGNLEIRDVRGNLEVDSAGSGSIDHSGVTGTVSLPRGH